MAAHAFSGNTDSNSLVTVNSESDVEGLGERGPDCAEESRGLRGVVEGQSYRHVIQVHSDPGGHGLGLGSCDVHMSDHKTSVQTVQSPRLLC